MHANSDKLGTRIHSSAILRSVSTQSDGKFAQGCFLRFSTHLRTRQSDGSLTSRQGPHLMLTQDLQDLPPIPYRRPQKQARLNQTMAENAMVYTFCRRSKGTEPKAKGIPQSRTQISVSRAAKHIHPRSTYIKESIDGFTTAE